MVKLTIFISSDELQMRLNYLPIVRLSGQKFGSHKAQEEVDHMARFLSSKEETSQLGTEPPTSSLRIGYFYTIIQ